MNNKEKDKIKKFYHDIIGIKSETVIQKLAENSRIRKLNVKELLIKEKVGEISFLYKVGGIVKAYYKIRKAKIKFIASLIYRVNHW